MTFPSPLKPSSSLLLALLLALPVAMPSRALAVGQARGLKLALNWKPEPQFGGFYATTLSKRDEKHGVMLTILEGGSGTPTVQMLANGQVDLAIVSAEEILISNERNPKNQVLALFAVYQTNPQMIMCHAERGHGSLKEVFAGEGPIAVQNGLTYVQFLKKKYPKSPAKFVPYLGGLTNYLADKNFCQQGFATSEPLAAEKAGQPAKVFLVADEGFNPYTTVVAVRAEAFRKEPGPLKSAIQAIREGWTEYLKNPESANKHMATLNKAMDAATFTKSAAAQKSLIETDETKKNGLGAMTEARWSALAAQLKELGTIKTVPAPKDVFLNP